MWKKRLTLCQFSLNLVLAISQKVTTSYKKLVGSPPNIITILWAVSVCGDGEYVGTLLSVLVAMARRWLGYDCNLSGVNSVRNKLKYL